MSPEPNKDLFAFMLEEFVANCAWCGVECGDEIREVDCYFCCEACRDREYRKRKARHQKDRRNKARQDDWRDHGWK